MDAHFLLAERSAHIRVRLAGNDASNTAAMPNGAPSFMAIAYGCFVLSPSCRAGGGDCRRKARGPARDGACANRRGLRGGILNNVARTCRRFSRRGVAALQFGPGAP